MGIDISCDILDGLRLASDSIDYIYSQHALQQLEILEVVDALRELHRRDQARWCVAFALARPRQNDCCLPERRARLLLVVGLGYDQWQLHHPDTYYNYTCTPFTFEFAEELLRKAGFSDVRRVAYRQTCSSYPEVVALDTWERDSREWESFYVEAFKKSARR